MANLAKCPSEPVNIASSRQKPIHFRCIFLVPPSFIFRCEFSPHQSVKYSRVALKSSLLMVKASNLHNSRLSAIMKCLYHYYFPQSLKNITRYNQTLKDVTQENLKLHDLRANTLQRSISTQHWAFTRIRERRLDLSDTVRRSSRGERESRKESPLGYRLSDTQFLLLFPSRGSHSPHSRLPLRV